MKDETKINIVGKWSPNSESNGNVYDADGLSPTITCGAHGGCEPRIRTKSECVGVSVNPCSHRLEFRGESSIKSDATPALRATDYKCPHTVWQTNFRIRKLTEREGFRLMGVRDEDIDKIKAAGISKTQQYKMAGNSIVCDVLMAIFDKMFANDEQPLSLF